jgi:hypothetical protein
MARPNGSPVWNASPDQGQGRRQGADGERNSRQPISHLETRT